jgi:ABC-type branched-subunit amino acid transport system substrate-binding protein
MVQVPPPAAPKPVAQTVKVGLLLPLSGPNAGLGQGMLDAASMALFDVPGSRVELEPRDTRGTAEGAAAAAREVLEDGVQLLIGPLTAGEVEAVKPIAAERRVPVLAFSTAASLAGGGTYLLGFLPSEEVRRVVAFAREKGAQRFAILAPRSTYGQLVADALARAAEAEGVTVVRSVLFDPLAADPSPYVRELAQADQRRESFERQRQQLEAATDPASREALKRLLASGQADDIGFDAVLLPMGGPLLRQIAPLLPKSGIDPKRIHLLGTGLWDDTAFAAMPELDGAWYAAPEPARRADFEKRFQALYGHGAPRLSTLAYDAAALAVVLTRGEQPLGIGDATLTNPSGYTGLDGVFRLLPDGRAEHGLAVLEVHQSGPKVVSPAPQSFAGL